MFAARSCAWSSVNTRVRVEVLKTHHYSTSSSVSSVAYSAARRRWYPKLRTSNFPHIHGSTESWSRWRELRVSSVTSPDRLPRPRSPSPVRRCCRWCCYTADGWSGAEAGVMVAREASHPLTRVLTGMDAGGERWLSRNHAYCPRRQRETFHCLLSAPMRIFSGERAKSTE